MSKPNIILIGGGGHCKACIDVIEQENKFTISGIVDTPNKVGEKILGYPIIGSDNDLEEIAKNYDHFLISIGQIKSASLRIKLFHQIKALGKHLPIVISPLAHVSKHTTIGEGSIIMHHAIINAGSNIEQNCIINSKALIEHDVTIKDNCHISTGAIINGNSIININTFVGSGTIINQGTSIAQNSIIGSASLVVKNIDTENSTWIGSPVA